MTLLMMQAGSYLISFPLVMGEGWDGGGHPGPFPPHLNPPPRRGEEVIFWLNWGLTLRNDPLLPKYYGDWIQKTLLISPVLSFWVIKYSQKWPKLCFGIDSAWGSLFILGLKIAPTRSEDQSTLRVDDFHLKVSLKTVSARRVLFSDRG